MKHALICSLALALPAVAAAQQPWPVGKLAMSTPRVVIEIDGDKLKGQPARLAWSPDGKELYLQMLEGDFGKPTSVARHYVIAADSGSKKDVSSEPDWARAYWSRKSGQASPDAPAFKIALDTSTRVERAASTPMGGDLARGGTGSGGDIGGAAGGTSAADAIASAAGSQTVTVHTMKLGGDPIGEFVNSVIVPGLTFGWGPQGSSVIAYATVKGGKLVVMDPSRKKQELDGTKDAILPAWSDAGGKLAWVRKDGKKKYSILIADVAPR